MKAKNIMIAALIVLILAFIMCFVIIEAPSLAPFLVTMILFAAVSAVTIFIIVKARGNTMQERINRENRRQVNAISSDKKKYLIFGAVFLFLFPMFIPIAVIVFIVYTVAKKKHSSDSFSSGEKLHHGDERFDHNEDDCINCGTPFDESYDSDCMFCSGEDSYSSNSYDDREYEEPSFKERLSSLCRDDVNDLGERVKGGFSIFGKDSDEEPLVYSGTYDDKKEEAEGLKVLLKAGIIEKDEYRERLEEIRTRR